MRNIPFLTVNSTKVPVAGNWKGAVTRLEKRGLLMEMLNHYCGVTRDPRDVVRLTICNAGSLNILGSPVTTGVREGFETFASDKTIRAVILAGQSEKSMIGGADVKEM